MVDDELTPQEQINTNMFCLCVFRDDLSGRSHDYNLTESPNERDVSGAFMFC